MTFPCTDLGESKNIEVLRKFISLKGKTVVDAGCGNLTFSEILAELGAHVIAIDPDEVQASKLLNRELPENISFHKAGADCLPVADGSIDGVFFSYSLHHVPSEIYPEVFAEVRRVIRPDGFLYILEPTDCPLNQVMKLFHDEDRERALAQQAIIEHAVPFFEEVNSVMYHDFRRYDSFDDFATNFVDKSFNSLYTEEDVRHAKVEEAFELHGSPDYIFKSPKKVVCLMRRNKAL